MTDTAVVPAVAPLSVPVPMPLPQRGGIDSLYYNGRPMMTRLHSRDIPFVDEEAKRLGIGRAHFIRWATLQVAMQLHLRRTGKHRETVL